MASQRTHKVFTSYLPKHFKNLSISFYLLFNVNSFAQTITKEFSQDSISVYLHKSNVPQNKNIPAEFDNVIRIALLYFPELENIKIEFRVKKQASPLSARPTVFAIFRKASKRKYIITISNKVNPKFTPILLQNLSFNSKVGVIGHELSHINDYNKRNGVYFIKLLFMHLNKNVTDKFEFKTDMKCIEYGLGYQLLSWSKEVRLKLNILQWKGVKMNGSARERYMNPETIINEIRQNQIYNKLAS